MRKALAVGRKALARAVMGAESCPGAKSSVSFDAVSTSPGSAPLVHETKWPTSEVELPSVAYVHRAASTPRMAE